MTTTEPTSKPVAPVEFLGIQSGCGVMDDFELWNTTAPIGPHGIGASLSIDTIHALGFITPKEAASEAAQQKRQRVKDSFTANPWDPQ